MTTPSPGGVATRTAGPIAVAPEEMATRSARRHRAAVAAVNAALLTAIGSCVRGDLRVLVGVPATVAGCVVAWSAVAKRPLLSSISTVYTLLAVVAAVGLAVQSVDVATWYAIVHPIPPAVGLVAVGVAAAGDPRRRRAAVFAAAAVAVAVYAVTPLGVPHPKADVWNWTQSSAQALLRGVHPYTVTVPDQYRGAYDYGSTPTVFPYMPAVILLAVPATALLGDYRYALAICFPLSLILLRAAAAAIRADDELTDAATLGFVLFPRGAQMVAAGFTEWLLIAAAAALFYCAASRRRVAEMVVVGLLPAVKQYVAAPILLYALVRRRWSALAIALAVPVVTTAPFLLWDARATFSGVLYLVRAPIGFRYDSDSVTAVLAGLTGVPSPRWLGVVAQFAAAAVAYPLVRGFGVAGILLAIALPLFVCFLFATQAFVNYYAFVAALLLFAGIAFTGRREESA